MSEAPKRPLRQGKAPGAHEWESWFPGLWRCDWCDGFFASKNKPNPEATPMKSEDAERLLEQIERIDAKARTQ